MQLHGTGKKITIVNSPILLVLTTSYYFGNTGTEEMYTNLTIMNSFLFKAGHIVFLAKLAGFKGEIWLGETADAYDGGVNGISDSYLAGFL